MLTPANVVTASRPVIAWRIARMLVNGEKGVTPGMLQWTWPWLLGMAATDAEGYLARFTDKILPGRGLGASKIGEIADPVADTLAFLTVSGAALRAPRISRLAKIAVGAVLGSEGRKAAWAVHTALAVRHQTGQRLEFPPVNSLGKWSRWKNSALYSVPLPPTISTTPSPELA